MLKMTIDNWISERTDDNFIIVYDGQKVYDARRTKYEPAPYIMESLITDVYSLDDVIVLSI